MFVSASGLYGLRVGSRSCCNWKSFMSNLTSMHGPLSSWKLPIAATLLISSSLSSHLTSHPTKSICHVITYPRINSMCGSNSAISLFVQKDLSAPGSLEEVCGPHH